ncbi:hypothetical protein ASZ78_003776, partial [Callipepla squamata]
MLRRILQRKPRKVLGFEKWFRSLYSCQTPGRVGSQGSDSDSSAAPGNAVDVNNEGSSEGFICPLCMKSHGSAEELFKHYEAVHNSGIDSTRGGEAISGSNTVLFMEIESLERQLEEIQVENFNIKQMKDLFEQKAAQLSTEIVDLKAKYDEEISLREGAEQKMTNLTQELLKERTTIEDLKTELLQRPGVEDVAVLKKELVQVQTLMDKMTLERERESEKLKDECKHLQAEQANSESLTEKLMKKEQEYSQLEEKHNEISVSKKNVQASFHQKDLDCQQLQAKLSASEASIQRLQAELGEKGEAGQKLKEELSEVETKYQHLKAECKQLQQQREEKEQHGLQLQSELSQLHSKLLEAERQLGEAHGRLKEQRQLSSEKLMDKEQQVADLQLKLSRAEEQ